MTNTCFDRFSQIAMEPSFLTMSYMARVSVLCSCFHFSCMFSNVLWSNVRKQHSTHAWWFCYCVNTFISMSRGNLRESPGLTVMFCANFISLQSREWRNLEIKCKTWSCLSMLKPFEKFEGFRTVLECEDLPQLRRERRSVEAHTVSLWSVLLQPEAVLQSPAAIACGKASLHLKF